LSRKEKLHFSMLKIYWQKSQFFQVMKAQTYIRTKLVAKSLLQLEILILKNNFYNCWLFYLLILILISYKVMALLELRSSAMTVSAAWPILMLLFLTKHLTRSLRVRTSPWQDIRTSTPNSLATPMRAAWPVTCSDPCPTYKLLSN